MKKTIFYSALFITLMSIVDVRAQSIASYPIPSYDVVVNGYANFIENDRSQNITQIVGKRVVDVEVKTPSDINECQSTVWAYTLDYSEVLGPFTVNCREPIAINIDDRKWGVLVESESEVVIDIWFE